jgi:hypothetical protein
MNTPTQPPSFNSFGTNGQAASGGYGQPTVTVTSTIPAKPASKPIQWGKIVKGAAIITGVVVAAVVGYLAFHFVAGMLLANTAVSAVAATTAAAAEPALGLLGQAAAYIQGFLGGIASHIGAALGIGSSAALTASQTATASTALGMVGAGAAVAIAAPIASHQLNHLGTPSAVDIDPSSMQTQNAGMLASMKSSMTSHAAMPMTGAHAMHDLTHLSQHAAEEVHQHNRPSFMQRFAPVAAFTSHADAARANIAAKQAPAPRSNASYAEQLTEDRQKLEATLGQKII